ncbi:hypothetical protein K474DRAFT_1580154, partial [Panus rudis PR-1116 ss-1]
AASLADGTTSSYGAGLRKFHLFCDIFQVPETARLPASFAVLKSFVLWAAADPEPDDPLRIGDITFEPIAPNTIRKYLAAVRAWHIVQGWPPPLSESDIGIIEFSLRGLERLQGGKPILRLSEPFDAAVWAAAACGMWGMMRFGETTVSSAAAFDGKKHLKRRDITSGYDLDGRLYVTLLLPSAKTAKPGETQSVYLVQQGDTCPISALQNLAHVVPAGPDDPMFSWRDTYGKIRPLVKKAALQRINAAFKALGHTTVYGHSFRIGGASFYLSQKTDPEVVRILGRWRSLAYEAYIRAFEQV